MLWHCWLGGRKGIRPGVVIFLGRGADLHMAQWIPLPLTVSCFSKIQIGFTFLVLAHPDSPGQRAIKWVCISFNQYLIAECVIVFCKSLPLSIPRSTFHHSYYHEVAGYTTAPREVFSLPSSLPSGDTSSSFVAWPVTHKVLFTIVYCSSYYLLV